MLESAKVYEFVVIESRPLWNGRFWRKAGINTGCLVDRRCRVCAIECDEFSNRLRLTLRRKSTYDRYLSACRIENGAASTGAYDTYAPFL
jgi:hypothetical protein